MPYFGYEFLKIDERERIGNKYLIAKFKINASPSSYFSTSYDTRSLIPLEGRLLRCIVNFKPSKDFNVSRSDVNELMNGLKELKNALKNNPDKKITWHTNSNPHKNAAREYIADHNKKCLELLSSGIEEKYSDIEYIFEPIPLNACD